MSLVKVGNLRAHCPREDKGHYVTVGVVFKETDRDGRLVLKINALPLPHEGWQGWVNVFWDEEEEA